MHCRTTPLPKKEKKKRKKERIVKFMRHSIAETGIK